MFGLNKKNTKNDHPQDVVMEMETMKNDLAGEKPKRENISLKSSYSAPIKKKNIAPIEEIRKISIQSPFANQPQKGATALSGKFLPRTEKRVDDESVLLPKKKEFQEKNISAIEKKEHRLENVISNQILQPKILSGEKEEKLKTPEKKNEQQISAGKRYFGKTLNEENTPKYTSGTNWGLIIATIFVFAIAISSGAYYYFFVLKQSSSESSPGQLILNQEAAEPTQSSEETEEDVTQITLPASLEEAEPLEIQEQSLIKTISTIPIEEINFEEGRIYEADNSQLTLDANSILNSLGISLSSNLTGELNRGWIFIRKLNGQNLRLGLILEIKNVVSAAEFRSKMLAEEKTLPTLLDNLYIEDQLPILDDQDVAFSVSSIDSAFRYFNFYHDKNVPSADWGIKTYETEDGTSNFLIFSTSMDTTRAIVTTLEQ